jgi:hypothetical protein
LGTSYKRAILSSWLARLSEEKAAVYERTVRALESGYGLFSISLNEALSLREEGELPGARLGLRLSTELASRHAQLLSGTLRAMEEHSRHCGSAPKVIALHPDEFRNEAAQQRAMWCALLHNVLFSRRARWFLKLGGLIGISADLETTCGPLAAQLAEGTSLTPLSDWGALEALHDDWNTCLQETVVLLKCFLTTLEAGEEKAFQEVLGRQGVPAAEDIPQWTRKPAIEVVATRPDFEGLYTL